MTSRDEPVNKHYAVTPGSARYDEDDDLFYAICDGCEEPCGEGQPSEYLALDHADRLGWIVSWDHGPLYCKECGYERGYL